MLKNIGVAVAERLALTCARRRIQHGLVGGSHADLAYSMSAGNLQCVTGLRTDIELLQRIGSHGDMQQVRKLPIRQQPDAHFAQLNQRLILEWYLQPSDAHGSAARSGDSCGHAAWLAGVVMIASNSIGVNRPATTASRPVIGDPVPSARHRNPTAIGAHMTSLHERHDDGPGRR
ncbi:hypothetical protein MKOR_17380 [Mycolicibacillus koreensis]|nr:hypothetical protein MKOR_17380 [Mycolicibacillus koreensis]